jgi:hypothetical protein
MMPPDLPIGLCCQMQERQAAVKLLVGLEIESDLSLLTSGTVMLAARFK